MQPQTNVWLEGVNGEIIHLVGDDEGAEGIWLATDVKGLYEPPVKVVYEEPGNYPGARYLSHRILRRDITFKVHILNDRSNVWMSRDSAWRKAWAFDQDCKIFIETPESGTRWLNCRLGESIDVSLYTDPNGQTVNEALMVVIAGDPFWYQDDVVYSFVTTDDTTFDPTPLPWPWPQEEIPTETITLTVEPDSDNPGGLNPTDQPVWLKWQVPGSTEAPSDPYIPGIPWLGAPNSPATIWTVPDYSFEDETLENRRLRLPGLIGGLRTAEVQKVSIIGTASGGTFRLTFSGQQTATIARNATAAQLKTALEALSNIAPGDVTVTGGPQLLTPKQPWKVSFAGVYAGTDVPKMTVTHTLTGDDSPYVQVDVLQEGFTAEAENCTIDTDPRVEQIVSENGSQIWARMNGVRFRHPVPPWTESKTFELTVSGAIPGQMGTLRIPRAWTRPWGLE
jgi:hypothetical protein